MKPLVELTVILAWIAGIVLAHGFWSTTFAITIPPYALYLVVEKLIHAFLP